MVRHDPGPRRSDSLDAYLRPTRMLAVLALLALVGGIVSDGLERRFWIDHPLLAGLAASAIVVLLTVALVNEALERRSRKRWRVLAQYVMLQLVRDARLAWTGMAELAGLMPAGQEAADRYVPAAAASLDAGADAVRHTARLTAALRELVSQKDGRRRLYDEVTCFVEHNDEVLGRWAAVMLNADVYAEMIDRHVELAGDLAWLGSVLGFEFSSEDERARIGRSHPSALIEGAIDGERLVRSIAAIMQLAERLDRTTLALSLQLVPIEWWRTRLGANAPTPLGDAERSPPERSLPLGSDTQASRPAGAPSQQ